MKLMIYALRDRVVGSYSNPQFTQKMEASELAETFRRVIVKDPAKVFQMKDCELYILGEFDDEVAEWTLENKPFYVIDLGTYFPKEDNHGREN